jgi:hypothetical protein
MREEIYRKQLIDPNRDFPYLIPEGQCLQSITAQTVYHLFAQHAFTTAITFHAGESHLILILASITYPWGAGNHVKGLPHSTRGYIEEKQSTDNPDLVSFAKIV